MDKSNDRCLVTRTMSKAKDRDSNIELLRIISMLLVMIVHADYLALGAPSVEDISASYSSSFVRAYIEALSCICVNVFIFISGWFGIRFRLVRLTEFIFQVLFISIVLYILMRSLGYIEAMSITDWVRLFFMKSRAYWFVKAYMIIYVFAPLLNAFVDNCTRSQLKVFLIGFYLLQSIYGFYASNVWFSEGYSPLSFMGLYILSGYMRLYPNYWMKFSKYVDMSIYLFVSAISAVCALSLTPLFEKGSSLMFLYSSPFVIIATVYFFLFFIKLSFRSNFINWVSISAFAVYLVHCSDYVFEPFYLNFINEWYNMNSVITFLFYTICHILTIFSISILFDKVRITVWRGIKSIIDHQKASPIAS